MVVQFDEEQQNKQIEELKRKEEEELVKTLAQTKFNIPYIDLTTAGIIIDNEALRFISEEDARKNGIAPFKLVGKSLHIAVRNPDKQEVEDFKGAILRRGYLPVAFMASVSSLSKVWDRYKELSFATTSRVGGLDVSGDTIIALGEQIRTINDVQKIITETEKSKAHTISNLLEVVLAGAIRLDASDVHFEVEAEDVRIRYRLDGVLHDVALFNFNQYKLINSRLKLLSGMKLTVTANAQDGRFSIFIKGEEINVRTSTAPGAYGESIVMRLLNPKNIQKTLTDLGMDSRLLEIMRREIFRPHGFILVTGPTGSGKTTTLYAFLKEIYSPELKMITIEDPVEYHLPGITQTQVEEEKNYTFLAGLRASLRQDPDVIMVGEIRDHETAEIAINASLTGHMVFSTLHTNNAAGVIPRMVDLGISPKILPSALTVSMAQRLVRKLCPHCRKERAAAEKESEEIRTILRKAADAGKNLALYDVSPEQEIKLYDPIGCAECNNIGYKGRLGVFEIILTNEDIEKIIPDQPSEREIKRVAQKQGILDMKEDGLINKVLPGLTSLEELKSVVDFYEN